MLRALARRAAAVAPASRVALARGWMPSRALNTSENVFTGTSAVYMEEMYAAWRADPKSVHRSWQVDNIF